jgi:hypothetical protein
MASFCAIPGTPAILLFKAIRRRVLSIVSLSRFVSRPGSTTSASSAVRAYPTPDCSCFVASDRAPEAVPTCTAQIAGQVKAVPVRHYPARHTLAARPAVGDAS